MPHNTKLPWLLNAIRDHNSDECLLWPFPRVKPGGYGRLFYENERVRAHRLVFYLTHGHWPTPEARHTCDNPICINHRHIIEGTHMDNMNDRGLRGRNNPRHGQDVGTSKLTNDAVIKIRQERPTHTLKQLSERYGVTMAMIHMIVTRQNWKHLP